MKYENLPIKLKQSLSICVLVYLDRKLYLINYIYLLIWNDVIDSLDNIFILFSIKTFYERILYINIYTVINIKNQELKNVSKNVFIIMFFNDEKAP